MNEAQQFEELLKLCPKAKRHDESGAVFYLLPGMSLPDGVGPSPMDLLLCATPRDGYNSRLYFSAVLTGARSQNWNVNGAHILSNNWHAFSWTTPQGLSLVQMVAAHLRALI